MTETEDSFKIYWGISEEDMKNALENPQVFDTGYKILFDIESFNKEIIPNGILSSKITGKVDKIITGLAGYELIEKFNPEYRYQIILDKTFDPVETSEIINPFRGIYRLTSYCMYFFIKEECIKFIPRI